MSLLENLDKIDKAWFTRIHADWALPSLDWFFLLLRNGLTWIPLYAFLLYWIIKNAGKRAIKFVALSVVAVSAADFISSSLMKPYFMRLRPCHDEVLAPVMRNILGCGGLYSMPSSHAANHFALATFWFFAVALIRGRKWHWLWLWAALICYAQVYVGKHYPFDILVGACLGSLIGYVLFLVFRKWTAVGV